MRESAGKFFSLFMLIYLFFTADMAILSGLGIVPEIQLSIYWEIAIIIRSLLYTFPVLIFRSKRELSEREMAVRRLLHFFSILAMVLLNEYLWDGIRDPKTLGIIAVSVFAVYILVFLGDCFLRYTEAEKMNRMLAEMKKRND
ncbi:MAG: DUF3021 family protein [Oscillospiraceae bacterium]